MASEYDLSTASTEPESCGSRKIGLPKGKILDLLPHPILVIIGRKKYDNTTRYCLARFLNDAFNTVTLQIYQFEQVKTDFEMVSNH
jgi:hypothetical protein